MEDFIEMNESAVFGECDALIVELYDKINSYIVRMNDFNTFRRLILIPLQECEGKYHEVIEKLCEKFFDGSNSGDRENERMYFIKCLECLACICDAQIDVKNGGLGWPNLLRVVNIFALLGLTPAVNCIVNSEVSKSHTARAINAAEASKTKEPIKRAVHKLMKKRFESGQHWKNLDKAIDEIKPIIERYQMMAFGRQKMSQSNLKDTLKKWIREIEGYESHFESVMKLNKNK